MATTKRYKIVCPSGGYYSHEFVYEGIRGARKLVRIWCVRNSRVTEPDILKALRHFVRAGGQVQILAIDEKAPASYLDGIRTTLPRAASSVDSFTEDLRQGVNHIREFRQDLGADRQRLSYWGYRCLPLIHFCQFDNDLYLGLQLVQRGEQPDCLEDLAIKANAQRGLGRLLIAQFEHVRNVWSTNYFQEAPMEHRQRPEEGSRVGDIHIHGAVRDIIQSVNQGGSSVIAGGSTVEQERIGELLDMVRSTIDVLPEQELKALELAVRDDGPQPAGAMGPRVSGWLGGVVSKVASGVYDASVEIVSAGLADILRRFYGL